jgi:hypothetical protein
VVLGQRIDTFLLAVASRRNETSGERRHAALHSVFFAKLYHVRAKHTKSDVYGLLLPKLQKIISRGYAKIGFGHDFLKSYIEYFIVPKADNVRPVYNGTSCGFNEAVWAPNFWLPTAKSATRVLDYNYCGVDIDLGDMFLNLPLPKVYRQFSGNDLGQFKSDLGDFFKAIPRHLFGVRWERCWKSKPLLSCPVLLLGRGDHSR